MGSNSLRGVLGNVAFRPRWDGDPFGAVHAGWVFEHKLDGFRGLATTGPAPALVSRNGLSYAAAFPKIIVALRRFPVAAMLDTELVVVDRTRDSQSERLRRRAVMGRAGAPERAAAFEPASLYAFDVLAIGDHNLRESPLLKRKERLAEIVDGANRVRFVDHREAHGEALFAKVCQSDFEGIVAKQANSVRKVGRRPEWIKVKNPNYSRQEALRFADE